jgi:translation initiation factor IF-3
LKKQNKNGKSLNLPTYRINDEINLTCQVRVTGEGIESNIMTLNSAKALANSLGLDLIEINSNITPAIVRIANYEKMMYDLKKSAKKSKQNQTKPLKEVQLSANIAKHDIETKGRKAKEFIEDGSKVKVVLTLRGREMSRRDENKKSLLEFIEFMDDVAVPESMPRDEGNRTIVILKKRDGKKKIIETTVTEEIN